MTYHYLRLSIIACLLLQSFSMQATDLSDLNTLLKVLEKQQKTHGGIPHEDTAEVLKKLGYAHLRQNDLQQTLSYLEQALDMFKVLHKGQNHQNIASLLQNIGSIYLSLENYRQSLAYCEQALTMKKALGHDTPPREDLAMLLQYIGRAYDSLSDGTQSIYYYKQALAMQQVLHSNQPHDDIVHVLQNVGGTYLRYFNDAAQSLYYYEQALEMRDKLYPNTPRNSTEAQNLSILLQNMGVACLKQENFQKSLSYSERALSTVQLAGYSREILQNSINIRRNMGAAYSALNNFKKSISYTKLALELHEVLSGKTPSLIDLGCWKILGYNYQALGKYKKSEQCYSKMLAISELLQNIPCQILSHNSLGNLYSINALNTRKEKIKRQYLNKANRAFEAALKANDSAATSLAQYANFLLVIEDYERAYAYLKRTIEVPDGDRILEYNATMHAMLPPILQKQIEQKMVVVVRAVDYAYYLLIHHYKAFVHAGITPEKSRETYLANYKQRIEASTQQPEDAKKNDIAKLLMDNL